MSGLAAAQAATLVAASFVSLALNRLLRPLLLRHALAAPNARSSHAVPTPQGGGIAVLAGAMAAAAGGIGWLGAAEPRLGAVAGATLVLAALGFADDRRPLAALPRLAIQVACVAVVIWAQTGRLLPEAVPRPVEWALLTLVGTWWVNAVNFMDGIDWMSVAEFVPLCGALALMGVAGALPAQAAIAAAALAGGLLGFAPANRPVARLFLGDVGSLPLGLVSGWLLLELALADGVAAAILLPLYYAADATITLGRRIARREPVWQAHRQHFYQQARANGLSVMAIDARVAALNLGLAGLAAATLAWPHPAVMAGALAGGAVLVGLTLRTFARPPGGRLQPDGPAF